MKENSTNSNMKNNSEYSGKHGMLKKSWRAFGGAAIIALLVMGIAGCSSVITNITKIPEVIGEDTKLIPEPTPEPTSKVIPTPTPSPASPVTPLPTSKPTKKPIPKPSTTPVVKPTITPTSSPTVSSMVQVPDIAGTYTGTNFATADRKLCSMFPDFAKLQTRQYQLVESDNAKPGTVVRTIPSAGAWVSSNVKVTIYIAQEKPKSTLRPTPTSTPTPTPIPTRVVVPNMVGMYVGTDFSEADRILSRIYPNFANVKRQYIFAESSGYDSGTVVKTSPAAGTVISPDVKVKIYIAE